LLKPRFGDGVDVVFGVGRQGVFEAAKEMGLDAKAAFETAGVGFYDTLAEIPENARRAAVLFSGNFDLDAATQRAIQVLSQNPNGFFLMVESDSHTEKVVQGLDRIIQIDQAIRRTAERLKDDTLVLFTADHSYDFRINGGRTDEPLIPFLVPPDFGDDQDSIKLENVVERSHGEE
jgi:alkaline phosphatase